MNHAIQPDYLNCTVTCACGNSFHTRATQKQLKLDICNACHPFYTGRQRFADTAGRIQRFKEKFKWTGDAAKAKAAEKQMPKPVTRPSEDE